MSEEGMDWETRPQTGQSPVELEKDPNFLKFCRSKIITQDERVKRETTGDLAHYWPLLCEKFNIPLFKDSISHIRFNQENFLTRRFVKSGVCRFGALERNLEFGPRATKLEFVHELIHAVCLGFVYSPLTPRFILEGIAQLGESFVWIPDADTKRAEIAGKPYQEKLKFARRLFELTDGPSFINPGVPGQIPEYYLYEVEGLKIPKGEEVYSKASGMFFRYLLETEGPEKLKQLGRHLFLKRGEKQIREAFRKIYGQEFEKIQFRAASYWCGEEITQEAEVLVKMGQIYSQILEKTIGKEKLGRVYTGHVRLDKSSILGREGDFDVLHFRFEGDDKIGYPSFFINPRDGTVVMLGRYQEGKKPTTHHFGSLRDALENLSIRTQ